MMQCFSGAMFKWYNVSVVQCSNDTMFQWYSVPMMQCFSGTVFQWCNVSVVQCSNDTMFQWCNVQMIQCFSCTVFQWYNVLVVQCSNDTMFQWCNVQMIQCLIQCYDDSLFSWNKSKVQLYTLVTLTALWPIQEMVHVLPNICVSYLGQKFVSYNVTPKGETMFQWCNVLMEQFHNATTLWWNNVVTA